MKNETKTDKTNNAAKKLKTITVKDLASVVGAGGDEGGTLKDGGTIRHSVE